MHIDLRQLRHFVALIEYRSFVAAAAAVNLSQSAFSRSIQTLEHAAGCQLVDRGHKDLPPTKQGQVVLDHARRLLREAHNLSNEISQFNDAESGSLLFGCGPAPATQLVPKAVARFIQAYPKARVHFQVDNWQELDRRLTAEDIEFFVADTRHFEANPDYRTIRLIPHKWNFCCRVGHPLTRLERVTTQDLFRYPIAASSRAPNIRKILVEFSGKRDFMPSVECEHGYALRSVVRDSDVVGITGSYSQADHSEAVDGLVILDVVDLPLGDEMYTRYGIVSRSERPLSSLAQAQIRLLLEVDGESREQPSLSAVAT